MAYTRLYEASSDLVNSVREANQTVANTPVTVLDRNMKFAQSTFLSGVEVLEKETNDMSNLAQVGREQLQQQQDAFQRLTSGLVDLSMNFLRTWFSFPQQAWSVTRSTVDRELQSAQDALQQRPADTR